MSNVPSSAFAGQTTFNFSKGTGNHNSGVPIPTVHFTGANRIIFNQLHLVGVNALQAGRQLAEHPLGGDLYSSANYYPTGSPFTSTTYLNQGPALISFGNSPHAGPNPVSFTNSNPVSYIQFSKKLTLTITSGQLLTEYYVRSGNNYVPGTPNIYAIGNCLLGSKPRFSLITVNPYAFNNFLLFKKLF